MSLPWDSQAGYIIRRLADPGLRWLKMNRRMENVLRCPECSAEIDVDEDEVEEGEILSCPECECELEVSQTHPVALNPISDDVEEDEDEEDGEDEDDFDENGDLLDDEEEEDDLEEEEEEEEDE